MHAMMCDSAVLLYVQAADCGCEPWWWRSYRLWQVESIVLSKWEMVQMEWW
jgi:hypothetical protein